MRSEPLTKPYKEENELVSDTNQLKMHTADGKSMSDGQPSFVLTILQKLRLFSRRTSPD